MWKLIRGSRSSCIIIFLNLSLTSLLLGQNSDAFVTVWKTDNLSSGSSDKSTVIIPTHAGHTYNYDVDWDGDGSYDELGITSSATHTYLEPGTYQIAIRGQFPRIFFDNNGDRLKIIAILQWGSIQWENMNSAFDGCANLIESANDAPDLDAVASMSEMFRRATGFKGDLSNWDVSNVPWMVSTFQDASSFNGDITTWNTANVNSIRYMFDGATSFNQDISQWNLSKVTTLQYTFRNASSFNQNLGAWDIDLVTNMTGMLDNCGLDRSNYDLTLLGWSEQDIQPNLTLGANSLQYCNGLYGRDTLTSAPHYWTIVGDNIECSDALFITTWQTDLPGISGSNSVKLPGATSPTSRYDVDWENDGTFDDFGINGNITHQYDSAGTYQIAIRGRIRWKFAIVNTDNKKLLSVDHWGETIFTNYESAFAGCSNMNIAANDAPNFKSFWISNLKNMFWDCSSLSTDLNHWDVSQITNMEGLFKFCDIFNGDIINWNVEEVTNMKELFYGASAFNQDISGWEISNVTNMQEMFRVATSFNQDLNNWDVDSVTNMNGLFRGANSYNQDMDMWDVSKVLDMSYMFSFNVNFNANIDNWDVDSVQNMQNMFWQADAFNRNITGWDVSSATNMNGMFKSTDLFNQDIGQWNVSNAENLGGMLSDARFFNHSLGDWDLTSASNIDDMLNSCGMTTTSYEATLEGWSQSGVPSGLTLGARDLIYCDGINFRDILTSAPNNWIIEDDIMDCDNVPPCNSSIVNISEGPFDKDWYDDFRWSLDIIPNVCHNVVVATPSSSSSELSIEFSEFTTPPHARCHTIEVEAGGRFRVDAGATLVVGLAE